MMKKIGRIRRGACVLTAACVLAGMLAGCAAPAREEAPTPVTLPQAIDSTLALNDKEQDAFLLCAEDGGLKLYVNPSDGTFYVEDTVSGAKWYSNPEDRAQDAWAQGVYRMELSAAMIVSYFIPDTGEKSRFNTMTGSVTDGDFTIEAVQNGVCIRYHFSEYEVTIPLYIYLDKGSLCAKVPTAQIENKKEGLFLYAISVLPYFGAGGEEDTGYLVVPDGSGGVIDFHNGKEMATSYMRPIYGMEPTEVKSSYDLAVEDQDIKMPVFGIQRNQHAFLAVVEDGAEIGTINANGNEQITSYANVYAEFAVKGRMDYSIGSITTPLLETGEIAVPLLGLRYTFLSGEEADYSGMARAYHTYLQQQYGLKEAPTSPALYVELYAGVRKTVSRLGIQMDTVVPLTTTAQVQAIAEELRGLGVENLVVSYRNWNKAELEGRPVTSAKIAGGLQKGGVSLRDLGQSNIMRFYPALNDVLTYSKANFFTRTYDTVCDISGVPIRPRPFNIGLGDEDGDPYYYVTYDKLTDFYGRLKADIDKAQLGPAAFDDLGRVLYNDYRTGNRKRTQTRQRMEEVLAGMGDSMFYSPNIYALPHAAELFGLPTTSSGQDLIDRDIPFYQIAVSGFARYSCPPLNNSNVGGTAFLKAVETGSSPTYTWIAADVDQIKGTTLGYLSGSHYTDSRDQAVAQYQRLRQAADAAGGTRLYAHGQVADGVTVSTYKNGARIYVNYTAAAYTLEDGTVVPAGDFTVVKGAA